MSAAAWLLDALIASALLMAAVMLVRGPVRRAFGPQLAYSLWALPALRLLLPPMPDGWWRVTAAAPITRAGETLSIYVVEPVAGATGPSLGSVLLLVWTAGAVGLLGWHIVRHHLFCARVLRLAEPLEQQGRITVVASAAAPGPIAFGVWRRFVVFPRDFAQRYDADERALALAHELGHHARGDLHANWVALAVLALHWFNPLAWRAFAAFRADQERANDARVLAGRAPAARHAYGRAIVKAAHGRAPVAACHLHTVSDLKGRLKMLGTSHVSRRRLAAGSAAVALLVAGGLGLTASSSAAEQIRQQLDRPLPPLAPVAPIAPVPVRPVLLAQAPSTPPAPVAPPATVKAKKHVVVVKDGKTTTYEGADADRYIAEHDLPVPPIPPAVGATPGERGLIVRRFDREGGTDGKPLTWRSMDGPGVFSVRCPDELAKALPERGGDSGKKRIVICTDGVAGVMPDARRLALQGELFGRNAILSARANLGMARAAIERDRNLSEDQKRQALAGIAQAETELRSAAKN